MNSRIATFTQQLVTQARNRKFCLIGAVFCLVIFLTAINLAYPRPVSVSVRDGNRELVLTTRQATVAKALAEHAIRLDSLDQVVPAVDTPVSADLAITIIRIEEKNRVAENPLSFPQETRRDNQLPAGERKIVQTGQTGIEKETIREVYQNGALASQETVSREVVKPPVPEITAVGSGNIVSRGGKTFRYSGVLAMLATAYDPGWISNGKWAGYPTADGIHQVEKGVVAVDPRVIPLGTRLYVEGYGYAIAADTGGAIKGNRIDLAFNTYEEAIQFGMKDVKVYILE
jgi:3D (Asp-Asp-Asp) domain-containing protein